MAETINYVKFVKGTPFAYKKKKRLGYISEDTLYFVAEEDANKGLIYLGGRQFGGDSAGVSTLDDLVDILIDDPQDMQLLSYDLEQGKWINVSFEDLPALPVFDGEKRGVVPANEEKIEGKISFLGDDAVWHLIDLEEIEQKFITLNNKIEHLQQNNYWRTF